MRMLRIILCNVCVDSAIVCIQRLHLPRVLHFSAIHCMRSEGYGSRPVCVSVCPGLSSATHATTRPSRHTYGLSIVLAPELIWRFSYNGFVSKIAIAFPYFDRTVVGHFFNAKRAHFPHSFRILRS